MRLGALSLMLATCVTACAVLSSCASVQTKIPKPDQTKIDTETAFQEIEAFMRYLRMLKRLDKVSAQVLQANADLCQKTRLDFGILTHSQKTYPKHLRQSAARRLRAQKTPSILLVRPNSPAYKVGVGRYDVLIDGDDNQISSRDKSLKAATKLTVRRADQVTEKKIQGIATCDYPVSLKMSGAINAYANGRSITVTTGMMDFVQTDAELALVVGHELAHNTQRHVRKAIWNTVISGLATRTTRPFEAEADYVGLYYMARAGYDLDGVETFWRRLGVRAPKSIVRAKTHPVTPERLLSISIAAQEIADKRAAGAALLPNYLDKSSNPHAP